MAMLHICISYVDPHLTIIGLSYPDSVYKLEINIFPTQLPPIGKENKKKYHFSSKLMPNPRVHK